MSLPGGLFVFGGIITACYSRIYPGSVISFIASVCAKIMHVYSVIEYRVEQAVDVYNEYKSQYITPFLKKNTSCEVDNQLYIKDNIELKTQPSDSFDFILLKKNDCAFIDINIDSLLCRSHLDCACDVSFMTFDVTFTQEENVTETFSLNTKKLNYIQVGNRITRHVIWYLLKEQYNKCYMGEDYSWLAIDNKINMFTLTNENTMTIMKDCVKVD